MSSTDRVPETWMLGERELSADHAWQALRRYGGWHLLRDAFLRFRSGDGFSHARTLGVQLCLTAVPLLIALNGLASKLGDPHRAGRVVADTVLALTPGASESLVSQLLTDQGLTRDLSQVALALGLLTAVVALATAAGQIERGANRIYGVDQDRPALQKYLRALLLTFVAGLPALVSFLLLVAGGAIGVSMEVVPLGYRSPDDLEHRPVARESRADRGDGVATVPVRTSPTPAGRWEERR